MPNGKKLGILTAGGDCPGLNAVIRGVVKSANIHGYEVLGFLKGYEGLVDPVSFIPLTHKNTTGILGQGEEAVGQFPRFPEVAADLVEHPQPPEHQEERRGLGRLLAQHAGPGVGALRFRGRVPLDHLELQPQGHEQGDFAA